MHNHKNIIPYKVFFKDATEALVKFGYRNKKN